jgi:hypothetical protein
VSAYEHAPFIVIWDTTRACALAWVHCRAEAIPHRDPRELTMEEGRALIDAVRGSAIRRRSGFWPAAIRYAVRTSPSSSAMGPSKG